MPSRADIDPTEIPRLLPNLLISEHVADAGVGRWRYRLAGTAAFGRNPTGIASTSSPRAITASSSSASTALSARSSARSSARAGSQDIAMSAKRLLLPLTTDGRVMSSIRRKARPSTLARSSRTP